MTDAALYALLSVAGISLLSFVGAANANVARMVVGDINARGGLLGRRLELIVEDGATDDAVAAAKASKLVQEDRVDVLLGGIYSSTRQAIKGPAVAEGRTLYIYPEQYEGQETYSSEETPAAAAPLPQDPAPVEAAPPTAPDPGPPATPDAEAAPEPSWTTEQPADESPSQRGGCCKICRKGCACGNTCISCSKTCRVGPGCACDG